MNKVIYDSYKKLSVTAKSEVRFRLKDSPVGLSFFDFLEKCSNRNFKNRDVVEYIYSGELENTPYSVLENRFFKLRKKIADDHLKEATDTTDLLAEEELELHKCKQLIRDNDKETAYQRLSDLEKQCWEKNIFELLPVVIDQLIFCNQSFNRLDRNKDMYARLEKAIALHADNSRTNLLARKVYEINFTKGMKHAKKELDMLKDLAVKNKNYPRFEMCYHHIALYYKLGSIDYVNDMQVISRHYTAFTRLFEKHPLMPLVGYKVNYSQYQHFHFKQIAVFYHFNRCEFEEAYLAMKEMWTMAQANMFRIYKTESLFFNMINAMVASERYAEADALADEFMGFLKENGQAEKMPYAFTQKALIWSAAYPKMKNANVDMYLNRIEEYQKMVKRQANIQISHAEAETLKGQIYLIKKEMTRAQVIFKSEEVKKFLSDLGVYDLFLQLVNASAKEIKEADRKEMREALKKDITSLRYRTKSPSVLLHLRWLAKMIA